MSGPERKQPGDPGPRPAAAGLIVLLASGALSGAVVVCLGEISNWMFLEGPPVPLRIDSSGQFYNIVAEPWTAEHYLFLARSLLSEAPKGLPAGLFGGLVSALFMGYCPRASGLVGLALFWGMVCGCFGLLASILLLDTYDDKKLARVVQPAAWAAALGSAFGLLQAALARPFHRLLGRDQHGR